MKGRRCNYRPTPEQMAKLLEARNAYWADPANLVHHSKVQRELVKRRKLLGRSGRFDRTRPRNDRSPAPSLGRASERQRLRVADAGESGSERRHSRQPAV